MRPSAAISMPPERILLDVEIVRDVVDVRDQRPLDGVWFHAQVEIAERNGMG